ncbi:MAG TPA: hypothetical protein GX711_02100 [Clostridia bacterium]|nr:hypothetical protein [Clostridia bacterium]
MKPYIRKKSDFVGGNPIVDYNKAGIVTVRDGGKYNIAVEMDQDTVVWVEQTEDRRSVEDLVQGLTARIPEIREQFAGCRPD